MRQFYVNTEFRLHIDRYKEIGRATKLFLSDCSIMIPTVWITRFSKRKKGVTVYIKGYWASEVSIKIKEENGTTGRHKSLLDAM